MRILVRQHALEVDDHLRAYTLAHTHAALGRFDRSVGDVVIRFTDVNGPKGGDDDKSCTVHVGLPGRRSIHVEERAADLAVALDLACDRAARLVAREVGKAGSTRVTGV